MFTTSFSTTIDKSDPNGGIANPFNSCKSVEETNAASMETIFKSWAEYQCRLIDGSSIEAIIHLNVSLKLAFYWISELYYV